MELRWQPNFDVAALHAAWVIASGRSLIDVGLDQEMRPIAAEFQQLARLWSIDDDRYWRQLIGLAADTPSNTELADRLLKRLVGGSSASSGVTRLASVIASCESVMRRRFPNLLEELVLRIAPLQSAWEARGPGLMAMISASTEPEFLVETATVILAQPVCGGDGLAHLYTNRVHIEAVLTDIDPRLPEVLRLAWLLGQLNLDRPIYCDQVHGHALGQIAELALIPVVLAAAQEVQLAQLSPESIELALVMWMKRSADESHQLAEVLATWWETSTEGDWSWQTRLAGLSAMVGELTALRPLR